MHPVCHIGNYESMDEDVFEYTRAFEDFARKWIKEVNPSDPITFDMVPGNNTPSTGIWQGGQSPSTSRHTEVEIHNALDASSEPER